jgi:hypothetical protein
MIHGSAAGLTAAGHNYTEADLGIDESESNDRFGGCLAAGDFDGDGRDDLIVAATGEDSSSGVVCVLYGSPDGIGAGRTHRWSQVGFGIEESGETANRFGSTLVAGDFDGNGVDAGGRSSRGWSRANSTSMSPRNSASGRAR